MKLKYFLQLIILFFFLWVPNVYSQTVEINDIEARTWAENKGREIIEILTSDSNEKFSRLDNILQNDVDLNYAAKFVVGKYWRQMDSEQQKQYLSLFNRYVSSIYKSYDIDLQEGAVDFKVDKVLVDNKGAHIFCTVYIKSVEENVDEQSQGGIQVTFIVIKDTDGFKVRDMKIQESSFLQSYRSRFYEMIHKSDDEIEWFLEDFEDLVTENENNL